MRKTVAKRLFLVALQSGSVVQTRQRYRALKRIWNATPKSQRNKLKVQLS